MVAAVHPARAHTDESISTCRFAQRVAKIQNDVSKNEAVDPSLLIARLQEENRRLRDGTEDEGGAELTGADLKALRRAVRSFILDPGPAAGVEWGRGRRGAKVRHAMWMLKTMLRDGGGMQGEGEEGGEEGAEEGEGEGGGEEGAAAADTGGGGGREASLRRRIASLSRRVDEKERECAALQARLRLMARAPGNHSAAAGPPGGIRGGSGGEGGGIGGGGDGPPGGIGGDDVGLSRSELSALSDRDAAAHLFATSFARGVELARARSHAQASLRPQLDAARALGAALVAARDEISSVRAAVEARRVQAAIEGLSAGGAAENTGGEEEELRLVGALHQKKEEYKNRTAELKHLKMHVGAMQARCQVRPALSRHSAERRREASRP
jgi:kinesin family protein 6/9